LIALANAVASISWGVVPVVSLGVSSSTGSMCADSGCAEDMFAEVGGHNGDWVPGIEFPEGSREVEISSIPAILWVYWNINE